MTDPSRKQQLADALRDVVAEQAREAAAQPRRRQPRGRSGRALLLAACGLWGVVAWLWVARPDWLFAPPDLARLTTPAQREAAARFALYLEKARISRFLDEHGQLPTSLAEAGEVEAGVTWQAAADGYILEARVNETALRLSDRMDADSFLGDAISRLPRQRQ